MKSKTTNNNLTMPFMTAKQAADEWGISLRRVSKLCQDGRVPGAYKMARIWLIPIGTKKPSIDRNAGKTAKNK